MLHRGLLSRRVLFFRDQGHISRRDHVELARLFGECGLAYGESPALSKHDQATTVGHQTARDDATLPKEVLVFKTTHTDAYVPSTWHSDATWAARPPLGSILVARQIPRVGGDTVFVDTAAAWSGLRPALQQELRSRRASHGRPAGDSEGLWKGGAVQRHGSVRRSSLMLRAESSHPVMRTHPETGEPHLFVNPTFTTSVSQTGSD
eukprot:COSAG01_NODE_6090_length_3856_cov_6.761778_4_plen_206_part_00